MTETTSLFSASALAILETALNKLISTRSKLSDGLVSLDGKQVALTVTPQEWNLSVLFSGSQVLLSQTSLENPDAEIRGSVTELFKLATNPRTVLFGKGVEVRGDATLIQKLQSIVRESGTDWEQFTADLIGDLPTGLILQLRERVLPEKMSLEGFNWPDRLRDYLEEELRAVPAQVEVETYFQQIAELETEASGLKQRIDQLSARIKKV